MSNQDAQNWRRRPEPRSGFRQFIETIGLCVAVVGGVGGFVGAFYLLPYRMEGAEKRLEILARRYDADHELLLRIEERIINLQQEMRRKP